MDAINREGLTLSDNVMRGLLKVDAAEWVEAIAGQDDFLKSYGRRMPKAMWDEHEALARRIDGKVTAATAPIAD